MKRSHLLLPIVLLLLVACRARPLEPLPTPPPWTPVPLSPQAITPENAGQVQALNCVQGRVTGRLAFSPDGRLLAVAAGYGVSLYDARSLAEVQRLDTPAHTRDRDHYFYHVWSVAFAPDGATLAAGNSFGWVHIWRVGEPEPLRDIQTRQIAVVALAFSADGETLATASFTHKTVRIWRVADGELLRTLEGFQQGPTRGRPQQTHVAFSPDGSMLAWAANDQVNLWRVSDGRLLRRFSRAAGPVRSLAFSPDGTTVATGHSGLATVWRVADGAWLCTIEAPHPDHRYLSVALAPGSAIVALSDISLARVSDGVLVRRQSPPNTEVLHRAWLSRPTARPWPRPLRMGSSACGAWSHSRRLTWGH